jgi:O-acetyl-ADP-ribose deacetylase (regulator of RNase III)
MQSRTIGAATLSLLRGDITAQDTDAIVNAANAGLAGGGGVDGAIHRAGGPSIMEACRAIGGCPAGGAVITPGGDLAARHVIHAVAPRWQGGGRGEAEHLESAYRRSLEVAEENDVASIAFPSLGTGAYRYPVDEAARIALDTVCRHLEGGTKLRDVRFVLFDAATYDAYQQALSEQAGT